MDIKQVSRSRLFNGLMWFLVLMPLIMVAYGFYQVQIQGNIFYYGPEPGKAIVHFLGEWAVSFLLLVIAIRPIHKHTQLQLRPYSRRLGLAAFAYGICHVLAYFAFIQGFVWQELWDDLIKRPYIIAGALALLMLLPLAVTSTKGWMRRLRHNWKRLHYFVYPATILVAVHIWWQVRADFLLATIVSVLLLAILFLRFSPIRLASR